MRLIKTNSGLMFLLLLVCLSLFAQTETETVYITATGQKYHRDGCTSLRRSKIAISLTEAVNSGYTPCDNCNPPVLDISSDLYRVNRIGITSSAKADTSLMLTVEVIDHVDGDTVRVQIHNPPVGFSPTETIRLLGVDTPETVHPSQPVQRFGKEASDFTKNALLGQTVFLAFDWDIRDHYGRLLAYIYTAEGQCFNAALIREGYAFAYIRYPFQFMDEFKAIEQDARSSRRGLWNE